MVSSKYLSNDSIDRYIMRVSFNIIRKPTTAIWQKHGLLSILPHTVLIHTGIYCNLYQENTTLIDALSVLVVKSLLCCATRQLQFRNSVRNFQEVSGLIMPNGSCLWMKTYKLCINNSNPTIKPEVSRNILFHVITCWYSQF